jgi:hypothetical protein
VHVDGQHPRRAGAGDEVVYLSPAWPNFAAAAGVYSGRLSRCTRTDWVELEVTWNNYKAGTPWTAGGGDFDDIGPPAKIDYEEPDAAGIFENTGLAGWVTDALNNRGGILTLIVRLVDESSTPGTRQWDVKPRTDASPPKLEVDYTPAPGGDRMRGRWP